MYDVTMRADAGAAPGTTEMLVVGVRFYQQLNGQLHPLQNAAAHPLAVVYAV